MVDQKILILLERFIDRDLSPAERSEVEALISADDEVRAAHDKLVALRSQLEEIGMEPPPSHLRNRIQHAIPWKINPEPRGNPLSRTFGVVFSNKPVIRYAFVFAGGLAAGLLLVSVMFLYDPFARLSHHEGSIMPPAPIEEYVASPHVLFGEQGKFGGIRLMRSDNDIVATILLKGNPGQPLTAELMSTEAEISSASPMRGNSAEIFILDRSVTISTAQNSKSLVVLKSGKESDVNIHIRVLTGTQVVFEGRVPSHTQAAY